MQQSLQCGECSSSSSSAASIHVSEQQTMNLACDTFAPIAGVKTDSAIDAMG
jgi:hypothetical protein